MTVVIPLRDRLYSILRLPDSIKQVLHCLVSSVAKVNENAQTKRSKSGRIMYRHARARSFPRGYCLTETYIADSFHRLVAVAEREKECSELSGVKRGATYFQARGSCWGLKSK